MGTTDEVITVTAPAGHGLDETIRRFETLMGRLREGLHRDAAILDRSRRAIQDGWAVLRGSPSAARLVDPPDRGPLGRRAARPRPIEPGSHDPAITPAI